MTEVDHVPLLVNSHTVAFQDKFDSPNNVLSNLANTSYLPNGGPDNSGCLRATYAPNSRGSAVIERAIAINDSNRTEYTLEYYLFFEPGFEWVKGGKLPGLRGGPLNVTTTGCVLPQPTNAWSFRLMWKTAGNVILYIYDQTRNPNNVACGVITTAPSPVFQIGKWHRIQIYMKLNSAAMAADGVAEVWVDNQLIIRRAGIPFRGDNAATIDHILFSTFYGGHTADWAPSKTTYIRFDKFTLYKGKATNIAAG